MSNTHMDWARLDKLFVSRNKIELNLIRVLFIITVLATKTRLSTLKSNITLLKESKTKLNIKIKY